MIMSALGPHRVSDSDRFSSMSQPPDTAPPPPGRRFARISADQVENAIRVLVRGDRAAASRFMSYARSSNLSLKHLWGLVDEHGGVEATALVAPAPGRTAMLFASRAISPRMIPVIGGLVNAAIHGLGDTPVALAQALVDPADQHEEQIFLSGGFRRMAELDYLERPVPRFGAIPPPDLPPDTTIEPWDGSDRGLLEDLLQRTYEHTLDCPGLSELRRTSDILDGHLASGTLVPEWWLILRVQGRPEGVLMLNRGTDSESVELVYLGLSVEARGRGFARVLLTYGLSMLNDDRARSIVLAVDRANMPAIRLYRRAGFRFSVRRIALVRAVESAGV